MIKLSPIGRKYKLIEDFKYKGITVPEGFETDGATMKVRLLYSAINKFDPRIIEAVVMHDYLCEKEYYKLADYLFEDMLPNIWQKKYMVFAVKVYHKLKYGV